MPSNCVWIPKTVMVVSLCLSIPSHVTVLCPLNSLSWGAPRPPSRARAELAHVTAGHAELLRSPQTFLSRGLRSTGGP